jgi:hypothetical protein
MHIYAYCPHLSTFVPGDPAWRICQPDKIWQDAQFESRLSTQRRLRPGQSIDVAWCSQVNYPDLRNSWVRIQRIWLPKPSKTVKTYISLMTNMYIELCASRNQNLEPKTKQKAQKSQRAVTCSHFTETAAHHESQWRLNSKLKTMKNGMW